MRASPHEQGALDLDGLGHAVDDATAALLDRLATDREYAADRARIVRAVLAEGRAHGGRVDQNRVRARLVDPATGKLAVKPQLVGPVVRTLVLDGALAHHSWGTNEDRASGNGGKLQRVYALAPYLLRATGRGES